MIPTHAIRSNDVLNGRGNGVAKHQGNIAFRSLVRANSSLYRLTNNIEEKHSIVYMIWEQISAQGGRFLTPGSRLGWYRCLNESEIMQKIQQALRDSTRPRSSMDR